MKDNQPHITIIGAGVSGLTAAVTLQNAGYKATVYDSNAFVGGRVSSDVSMGLILDHGFQVMLDAYPAVNEFLDTEALKLRKFVPGSVIFKDGKTHKIGDPTRDSSFLWSTITAGVGSLKDKWLVFSLSRKLKQKSIQDIFNTPETTTKIYLENYGFSNKMIASFFTPFYTGIFLEADLATSSRMFEYVFKMFTEGNATIPAGGIKAIPEQLAAQLPQDSIHLHKKVTAVVGNEISLENGEKIKADYTIVATQAGDLISNLPDENMSWHEVTVLYFETDHAGLDQSIIGLIANDDVLINNFHFLNDVFDNHRNIISVSVIKKHNLSEQQLIERVVKELREETQIKANELVKLYHIKKALPQLDSLNYCMSPSETQLTDHVFLAGDQLSNGSLNAAMLNGKAAANAVISKIEGSVIL
ncbi:NAD(P)/FAD-dependent oxidoreductase [uncultured Nonlabens sp.]|uniref:protoporphyrinogen/coproporphyrinogen oxidase n=1 Tax=uncultured Nonlabens sp. TaxID=859306 RepID=UPI00263060E4|nr:NAD(P)/FAD-dependent oxidoreductase [uncultured Nonlabens sp.]